MSSLVQAIFDYARLNYGVEPDYPFPTAPDYPVLRHPDTRKWFALIMDVPRYRLGLSGEERVDILNIDIADHDGAACFRQRIQLA